MLKILVFLICVSPFLELDKSAPYAKKSYSKKKTYKSKKKKSNRNFVISQNYIYSRGKKVYDSGNYTRIFQVDLISALFHQYKYDERIIKYSKRGVISGSNFGGAYKRMDLLLSKNQKGKYIESAKKPPSIKYKNFRSIILYQSSNKHRISINLKKSYTQEIPHTFGAKIWLKKNIRGTVRSTATGAITEVVFDKINAVFFMPPTIAFFLPDIHVKIASVVKSPTGIKGYVIGRVKGSKKKYMAIAYNLSTCDKTSIKSYKMSKWQYARKLNNMEYFDFIR
jgi:hypothetical protein